MKCVICGGSAFSMSPKAFNLPPEEQIKYTKYGDCCCLMCALRKSELLIAQNGSKKIIIKNKKERYMIFVPLESCK